MGENGKGNKGQDQEKKSAKGRPKKGFLRNSLVRGGQGGRKQRGGSETFIGATAIQKKRKVLGVGKGELGEPVKQKKEKSSYQGKKGS